MRGLSLALRDVFWLLKPRNPYVPGGGKDRERKLNKTDLYLRVFLTSLSS